MGRYLQELDDAAAAQISQAESRLATLTSTREWQAAKMTADVGGIFDPSPTMDLASFSMSVAEGDWVGATLSGVSFIPWLGDAAAKPFKIIRATRTIQAIEREAAALVTAIAHQRSTAARIARRKEAAAAERARRAKEAADRFATAKKCKSCPEPSRFGTQLPATGRWSGEKGNSHWTSDDGSVSLSYREGYPDFSTSHPDSIYPLGDGRVEIEMKGNNSDFSKAHKAMRKKLGDPEWPGNGQYEPDGYTWHHSEDGATMQLVKSEVHDKAESGAAHIGGESIVSGSDNLKKPSQF